MPRDRSLLNNVTSLVVCGLLAGLVVAAAAFPAIAVSGLAVKAGAESFEDLPNELRVEPIPQLTSVYANDGKTLITSFYDESRQPVALADVPQVMQDAIISVEDSRFYEHNGVDPRGVVRALLANSSDGEVSEGASTLTMQYVRNVLKYNAQTDEEIFEATEDTPERKIREMRYAMAIEKELDKPEILERYLNIAFFGNRAYGIYAASQSYFSKKPKDLELGEAAFIAGLVQAPGAYDPSAGDKKAATDRRNHVLDRMVANGKITQAQSDEEKAKELDLKLKAQPSECVEVPKKHNDWGFFCDFLKDWWSKNAAFGAEPADRLAKLKQGGYKIVTSLDPQVQKTAMKTILEQEQKESHLALGTVVIEPGTGRVRSMAVNRKYSLDTSGNPLHSNPALAAKDVKGTYPNTTVPLFTTDGNGNGGFQIGSTAKFFTMIAALENGIPLTQAFQSPYQYKSKIYSAGYQAGDSACDRLPDGSYHWCPHNDSRGFQTGKFNMWSGFGRSVNTYFVQLIERVGADKVVDTWEKMGVTWHNVDDRERATPGCQDQEGEDFCGEPVGWGTLTLGVAATTPMEVANAYATIAAEGTYCEPTPIQSITDRNGNPVTAGDPKCQPVISKDVARAATDAARCPIGQNSSTSKCDQGTFPGGLQVGDRDVAGKTGTTDNGSLWFAGFTGNNALATFHTDPDYLGKSSIGMRGSPHYIVSEDILNAAEEGYDKKDFKKPSEAMIYGKNPRDVPSVSCDSVEDAKDKMDRAGFKSEVVQGERSDCPKGTVYWTNPDGRAAEGSTITLYVSAGQKKDDSSDDNDDDNGGPGPDLPWPCLPPNDCDDKPGRN
ncbi:penicillin-binding protein [Phytomonospora endophytica]|nr:transglycosylase domain-containing protein [Phytomonospora endophytica]GIG63884.1 penicillin-binding protein [Phytomonospora endophytica]